MFIQKVIKRDGSVEDFTPHKLNKWGEWAAKGLKDRIDWSSVVLDAVQDCGETISSQALQQRLIDSCLAYKSWPYYLMAGRLYAAVIHKKIFEDKLPTVKELHISLKNKNIMRHMHYSDLDYAAVEEMIDHTRDFTMAHFQIEYILHKYVMQDRVSGTPFETPQFTYMRLAMALAEGEPIEERMMHVKNYYDHFSLNRINPPTPNYTNLGTNHYGLASCCLYAVDDNSRSLAIGDHIAYTQTYMSAGIGANIMCRSIGDGVRNGTIEHLGKLPYYKVLGASVNANLQGGRGGACTSYFTCFDPEVLTIAMLQNPKTPIDKQNLQLGHAVLYNKFFIKKVAAGEDVFLFNGHTAPDLTALFYSNDLKGFTELYANYEKDDTFIKKYVSARKIAALIGQQTYEVPRMHYLFIDEANKHTPFKETIYSSNLCLEVILPTKPYQHMTDLYKAEDHGNGEVALCTLAAIVLPNITSEEEYFSAAYYSLKMIDVCIDIADYELPHIGYTAKMRRNAAVGMIGLATVMARENLPYDSKKGRNKIHEIAERHAYMVISASLKLGKEKGNAPWIDKTKWIDGWTPIDTYNKNVDELVSVPYRYDWDALKASIVENRGIRNSSLIAHMPTESSSKASGVPNGVYPIRDLALSKSDGGSNIDWAAMDNDILKEAYQSAWEISEIDMIKNYAIIQKFTDQTTSADLYRDRRSTIEITVEEIINVLIAMAKYGVKSKYYTNVLTSSGKGIEKNFCTSGSCDV